jgi:hypothetical protein
MDATTRFAVAASCLFILLGLAVIPYAGIQNDESLFAQPLIGHIQKEFRARLFHTDIPLMVMSYIGTLKTLLYWPIFAILGAGVWALRLPMVLAGAATILLFFHLAKRAAGPQAASAGALLLATDAIFLMTDTFDWGPVALEHLLLVTACLFLVRFGSETVSKTNRDLALGCFFLGLALWNKAIFVWALAGLISAGVVVLWTEIRSLWQIRRAGIALAAFLCGALPFVIYNLRHPAETAKSNVHLSAEGFSGKFTQFRNALKGQAVMGFIAAEDWDPQPKEPQTRRGKLARWIRDHFGEHRSNGMDYACGLALLAVPLWWRSRAARFSLVFCIVTWLAMAVTRDAGGSAHHAVLLWPFPQLFLASTLAQFRLRALLWVPVAALAVMNLLMVNQYVYQLERNGAAGNFTDALFPLSSALDGHEGQPIYVIDWGMQNSLDLLHHGKLSLRVANDPFMHDSPSAADREIAQRMIRDPRGLFLGHVPEREAFEGVGKRADQAAAALGYRKELLQVIPDSNGRPVFELFRFTP